MNNPSRSFLKNILLILIILAGIVFISQKVNVFPLHDYIEYWAAGKINLAGGNPYSPDEMLALQQQVGWDEPDVLMMWNPPWLLALAMPFSILPYPVSRMMWFLLELFVLFFSADMLWNLYRGSPKRRWIAWIVVLAFGPTLHTLKLGQITSFLLIGSVGFLYFLKRGKPFWAGVLFSLVLLKPHLLYLLTIAVLIWCVRSKNWKVMAGIATGIVVPLVLSSLPNIHLISQYINATINYPPKQWQTATLGLPLRVLFGENLFFLQFVPSIIGVIWLTVYWFSRKERWNWLSALPLIVVISTATTSYGWAFDVSIVVIAITQIASIFNFQRWTIQSFTLFSSYWIVSLLNAFISKPQDWFWWLGSFFMLWYILAGRWLTEPRLDSVIDKKS